METELAKGAEATILRQDDKIIKKRVKKSYRVAEIDDDLRKSRTKKELKALEKAAELGVPVPYTYESPDKFTLVMDYIDGERLRDHVKSHPDEAARLFKELGNHVGILHNNLLIHGDLTTSNAVVADKLYLIDFGLSFFSGKIEDKAVDVHVFEEALESTHYKEKDLYFESFLEGYEVCEDKADVLARLEEVRLRGKNKRTGV